MKGRHSNIQILIAAILGKELLRGVLQDVRRAFRYTLQAGWIANNPAPDISNVLNGRKACSGHFGHRLLSIWGDCANITFNVLYRKT